MPFGNRTTWAAFTLACFALIESARAVSFSTNATLDAFVADGPTGNLSGNNYGGAGSISLAAATLPQGIQQSVMRFNLAGAAGAFDSQFGAGNWSIQSVTLQLTAAPANNAIFNTPAAGTFGISWMQNDSWLEGTGTPSAPSVSGITYNTLGNYVGPGDEALGSFVFDGATSGAKVYSLDLTSGFAADLASGGDLSLHLYALDASVSAIFNSRSFGVPGNRPVFTVVAVPEPGAVTLAGLGSVLILGWRFSARRRWIIRS